MPYELFTIGHSTHPVDKFIDLLGKYSITVICDVRSTPYSQYNPQFNRELLKQELAGHKISYIFMGKELGARSHNPKCYNNGKVCYKSLAEEPAFLQGLDRLREGMKSYRIALLCAEKDPITCHRTILICRKLRAKDIEIKHILEDGTFENNRQTEKRLMTLSKIEPDMFHTEEQCIEEAYDKQASKIAYVEKELYIGGK